MTDLVTIKVRGADTNDAYGVVEVSCPPGGGPPLHTHPPQETFFILEGSFGFPTVRDGAQHIEHAGPGSIIQVPPMVPHTYTNVGDTVGRFIAIASPADMEDFFAELGERVTDLANPPQPSGPPDFARVMAICAKYDIAFLPPA